MPRQYFPSKFYLDNRTRHFLWSSDDETEGDQDEVWTRDGVAPTFATLAQLETFAREEVGASFAEHGEPLLLDLSWVTCWLRLSKQRRARRVDASHCLAAWNIFGDLARGLKTPFGGAASRHDNLYFKVFWGNNLPSLTPPGKIYVPRWTGKELQTLHAVLEEGLKLWRERVR